MRKKNEHSQRTCEDLEGRVACNSAHTHTQYMFSRRSTLPCVPYFCGRPHVIKKNQKLASRNTTIITFTPPLCSTSYNSYKVLVDSLSSSFYPFNPSHRHIRHITNPRLHLIEKRTHMVEVWPPIRLAVPTCFHEALQVGHREQRRGGPLKTSHLN